MSGPVPEPGLSHLGLAELERRACQSAGVRALPLREWVALAEAWRIAVALREARGNRSRAARALGIGRRTLYSKMEKLGLVPAFELSRESALGASLAGEPTGEPALARPRE